jgi:putative membrane protein
VNAYTSVDLGIALVLALSALLYALGLSRLWRRGGVGAVVAPWRACLYLLGLAVVALALLSPLDALAHLLFSAHMVQHVLIIFVAAPLLALGAPPVPVLWGLPRPLRLAVVPLWRSGTPLRRVSLALTHPVVVWTIGAAVLWFWHIPGPYQAAVRSPVIHVLEHATMLASALLFWWVVVPQPIGRRRLDGGSATLLVFAAKVQAGTLGVLITFVPEPLYPIYEAGAASFGRTLLEDQHLAGLIMGTVGGLVYVGVGAALFLHWLSGLERRDRRGAPPRVVRGPPLVLGEPSGLGAAHAGAHERRPLPRR